MAIKRTGAASSGQNDLLPEGEYEGRLVYVADLGMQKREKDFGEGVRPPIQQLALGIEILGQTHTFEDKTNPMLMWTNGFNILRTLTEMGNELKRFKVFSPSAKEGQVADWDSVIGKSCSVQIAHRNGYANIKEILPIPEKYQKDVPEGLFTDGCTGDVGDEENPAQKAMYGLPRWCVDNNRVTQDVDSSPDFS
jgi:hypothetical protein